MSNNKDLQDKVFDFLIEEAAEKYACDIANEDVICDMTDEEIKIMDKQKGRIYKKTMKAIRKEFQPRHRFSYKKYMIAIAAVIILLALSFNVSAFKKFIFKTYTNMSGTILNITTSQVDEGKYDVIEEFGNKAEIIVPGWLPSGFDLTEIEDDAVSIELVFERGDKQQEIRISQILLSTYSKSSVQTEDNSYNVENCDILGMDGKIVEIVSEEGDDAYIAVWSSNQTRYAVHTTVDKETLKTILANLKYYKK